MSAPPEVKAQPADVPPSEWSPRPVPRDGVGRTTADSETPTLAELQERARQRASLTADLPSPSAYTSPANDSSGPPVLATDAVEGIDADALALSPADDDPCAAAAIAAAPKELQSQARQNVPRLMTQARAAGLTDDQTAYVLGTIEHESGFGASMVERHPRNYEGRRDIGNVHPGDGRRFIGRGFVQITGRDNYAVWGKRLRLDLVKHPELATDPDVAAAIAVRGMRAGTFTGKSLGNYVNEDGVDYVNARRIINGTDRADLIASYADRYRAAIRACRAAKRPAAPPSDSGRAGRG